MKTRPETGASGSPVESRKQLVDAGEQRVDPDASGRRPEEDRMDDAAPRLDRELLAKALEWERRLVADVGAEDRLVVLGEDLGQGRPVGAIGRA